MITVTADNGWTPAKLVNAQSADEDLEYLAAWKKSGQQPDWQSISEYSATLKSYWAKWDSLHLEERLLKRKCRMQVVLPRSKTVEVLKKMHGGPSGGHIEVNKTLDRIRERFYWLHV